MKTFRGIISRILGRDDGKTSLIIWEHPEQAFGPRLETRYGATSVTWDVPLPGDKIKPAHTEVGLRFSFEGRAPEALRYGARVLLAVADAIEASGGNE